MHNSTNFGNRASWDRTWADVARAVARRSRCERAQVGAVVVTSANRVAATGYNGPPSGYPAEGPCSGWCTRSRRGATPETLASYEDCPSLHAELNALMHSSRSEREGGTIYVTGHVCINCAKAIANSGLCTVVLVDAHDEAEAHRQPDRTVHYLETCGLRVRRLDSGR